MASIDSIIREVIPLTLTPYAYAARQEFSRGSCVVGWVQLDNQTQEPVAPVVVAPTMVQHPQATLQMSFIRNNAKSRNRLNHFEVRCSRLSCLRVGQYGLSFFVEAFSVVQWQTLLAGAF